MSTRGRGPSKNPPFKIKRFVFVPLSPKHFLAVAGALVVGGTGLYLLTASDAAVPYIGDSTFSLRGETVQFDAATPPAGGRLVQVASASKLRSALANAKPGDTIKLADGTYSGGFNATVSGTASKPITLTGSRNAIIKNTSDSPGYGLSLGTPNSTQTTAYWRIHGLTVRNAKKGIMLDRVQYTIIDNVLVQEIGEEGIRLRNFSKHNIIQNSSVSRTGLQTQGYGEGLYIGTAISNWQSSSQGKPDNSDNNQLLFNTVSQTTAESVDIKEGTRGGVIRGNRFDGSGMCPNRSVTCNSADSFLDLKGELWRVYENSGSFMHVIWGNDTPENDGFQVHAVSGAEGQNSGRNNTFERNRVSNVGGYGINVTKFKSDNVVRCNNTVTNAAKGLSNIACR